MPRFFLLGLLLLLPNVNVDAKTDTDACININTTEITHFLNTSYHHNCYLHTLKNSKCCNYFLHDNTCIDSYNDCIKYEDYILNNIFHQCSSHNQTLNDIEYSDNCHNFTLHLEPYCCDNLLETECYSLYSQCTNHNPNVTTCDIPPKYNNQYCSSYTSHVNDHCCNNFNDQCSQIYNWCLENNPDQINIFDMFLGPKSGHTIGSSLTIYHNIDDVKDCAQLCLDTATCRSFDYIQQFHHCHLSFHVVGDHVNGEIVKLLNDPFYDAVYYEKKMVMPYDDTSCNVKYASWLGDGICDAQGGYNTEACNYDGGDCCPETCNFYYCGILNFVCLDPEIVGYPTGFPSSSPTNNPSSSPTFSPTSSPTFSPTSSPTNNPSSSPTNNPSSSPTAFFDNNSHSTTLEPTTSTTLEPTTSTTLEPTTSTTLEPTTSINVPTGKPTTNINPDNSKSTGTSTSSNNTYSPMYIFLTILIILLAACMMYATYVYYKTKKIRAQPKVATAAFSNPLYDRNETNNETNNNDDDNDNNDDQSDIDSINYHDDDLTEDKGVNNPDYDTYMDYIEENTNGVYDDPEELNSDDLYKDEYTNDIDV